VSAARLVRRTIKAALMPSTVAKAAVLAGVSSALLFKGKRFETGVGARITAAVSRVVPQHMAPAVVSAARGAVALGAGGFALAVSNVLSTWALRALLTYKGFLYGTSAITKVWALSVKALSIFNTRTFSFQSSLPHLPVPALRDTVEKYLKSVCPLLAPDDFSRIEKVAHDFLAREGPKLQRYLVLKSWLSTNWLEEWWETYVYLKGRASIMINSNFYTFDSDYAEGKFTQVERAASVLHTLCQFRQLIEREQVRPLLLAGTVPLCMNGYDRLFGTTRAPGRDCDTIDYHPPQDSRHVVVLRNGHYYTFSLYDDVTGRPLSMTDLHRQISFIIQDADVAPPTRAGEDKVAALTAGPRTPWAEARETYFSDGVNRVSRDAIERAMVFLSLDMETPEGLDNKAHALIHGSGKNRWFDKSIQVIIFPDGRSGYCVEHAFADAPIVGHAIEWMMLTEYQRTVTDGRAFPEIAAGAAGSGPGSSSSSSSSAAVAHRSPPASMRPPARLLWDLTPPCVSMIDASFAAARVLIDDLDQHILCFTEFGKGAMKKCRVSPDAFIQVALQLAYHRDAGTFAQTYESATSRLFRNGRTETIRSCSTESCRFVLAMEGEVDEATGAVIDVCSAQEKVRLLKEAVNAHNAYTKMAMSGAGIDRHLFGLYVISAGLSVESAFLTEALSSSWTLSTSQTPANQTSLWNASKTAAAKTVGGGFGPVSSEGYGVSYIISGEDQISFHVASKRSCERTTSTRFAGHISDALLDIRELFAEAEREREAVKNKVDAANRSLREDGGDGNAEAEAASADAK
jgi:carnitine O-palmitoyltransferase 1